MQGVREERPGRAPSRLLARRELDFYYFIKKKIKQFGKCNLQDPSEGQGDGTESAGGISGLPAVRGSVGGKDLAALGPSLPRPDPGRGKAGPRGKRGRPVGGDQRSSDPLFGPWLVTLVLGQGAVPKSPVPLGSREEAGGENPALRGRGARPETAGMGAGEAGTGSARAAQLRPEPAAAGNSAQRWVSLSPLGPAGLGWGCRAPG